MEEHNERFVSVATFPSTMEAEVAQATLAAADIESYLRFDDVSGMMPFLQQIKGVNLLVEDFNAEEAKLLLSTPSTEQTD